MTDDERRVGGSADPRGGGAPGDAAPRDAGAAAERWDAAGVRALRARLGLTQAELAERMGTRQQTVSEWETGARAPRRMSRRLLRMVAEEAGVYDASPPDAGPGDATDDAGDDGRGAP